MELLPHPFPLLLCRYFNSGSAPLECDKKFWDLRDSVVQCELLILRQLNFYVSFEHPHKVCALVHVSPPPWGILCGSTRHLYFKCVIIWPVSVPPVFASLPDVSQVTRKPPRLVANPCGRNFLGFAEGLLPRNHVYPSYTPTHRHSNTLPGTEQLRCWAACRGKRVVAGVYLYSALSLSTWNTA